VTIRAIKMNAEGDIFEVNLISSSALFDFPYRAEVWTLETLNDAFADIDGTAIMVTDKDADELDLPWNKNASVLSGHLGTVRGDALFVGAIVGGLVFSLPERIGAGDLADLVERYKRR
jgi:hypothetical protein